MKQLDLAEIEARADEVDALALRTPDIDAFCSSSAWVLSAHEAFHPEQEPLVLEGAGGFVILARDQTSGLGTYLAPLEAMWGLASPVLATDSLPLARALHQELSSGRHPWDALWLCGLAPGSTIYRELALLFSRDCRLFVGPTTRRHVADLSGGMDGFLSRRTRVFRKNLRRARRRAAELGLSWEWHPAVPDEAARLALYRRLVAVDSRSWKGLSDQGLEAGGMVHFYEGMTARLAAAGRLRAVVARVEGEDVGMGFGAVFGDSFRGLQMSFDDRFRALGLGNLVQAQLIEHLADEGVAAYDLGTEMPYKERWSAMGLETAALIVRK